MHERLPETRTGPGRTTRRIARVERRFGLGTLMVGTVFFALLFALLRRLQVASSIVIAIAMFLVGIAVVQMLLRDERMARRASMIAGAVLYVLLATGALVWGRGSSRWVGLDPSCILVGWPIIGVFAGYVGGAFVAGIFLVADIVERSLTRGRDGSAESRIGHSERAVTSQPEVLQTVDEVRKAVRSARARGLRIGLVPTMGALHDGHLSLIRRARADNGLVAVSIFVNPMQFGAAEDLSRYPRPFEQDVKLCRQERVDIVFAPDVATMYPSGFASSVEVEGLATRLEGASRPGHFRGVATVVLKLFHIVQPDIAYFGQKDAQQARLIQQMVRDLDVPVEIRVCPTVREPDGLAISSRNMYLSADERQQALRLSRSLQAAREMIGAGERDANLVRQKMRSVLESAQDVLLDYAELVDPNTFESLEWITGPVLAVVAARVGKARLIDNLPIEVKGVEGLKS